MKVINAVFIAAALGYGALCLGCAPKALDPSVVKAADDPNWHHISPLPVESGFYKMYDYEDGRICYLVVDRTYPGRSIAMSLECQYNADEQQQAEPVTEAAVKPTFMSVAYDREKARNKPVPKKPTKYPCLKWPQGMCRVG